MALPTELDHDKLAEAALALLAVTTFTSGREARAWKGLDWDVLDLLFQRGWIENPVGKAKSVVLTETGQRLAPALLARHFGRPEQ